MPSSAGKKKMEGETITMKEILQFERTGVDGIGKVIVRFRTTGIRPLVAELLKQYFFFNATATNEIYTLSLHDALPIFDPRFNQLAIWTANAVLGGAGSEVRWY